MTLSTHVLDTALGVPAKAVAIRLLLGSEVLFVGMTDEDGRCPGIKTLDLAKGTYRLEFNVADYFKSTGLSLAEPPFLDRVSLEFGIDGIRHYHIPLLVSPYGYSTYRGS